jgi:hypothetical protein
MPVRPRRATPPGWSGVFRRSPPPLLWKAVVDGRALDSTPGEVTASENVRPRALIAPWSGFWRYMSRQVTPVAKAEIAIGRKMIVLNPTAQLMRSVRTAKRSPNAVTKAGTTATQIALFLIAVTSVGVVNSVL